MVTVTSSQKQRYGVAVLAVVLALLLMLWLNPWVAMTKSPFLMFFGAVMVSAWYGGMEAGLLATFLSAVLSTYFFIYPINSLTLDLTNSVRLLLFVLQGILFSALCRVLHTTNRRLEVSWLKLRASEDRYRRLIDTAYEGIWTTNAEGRIDYVNQRIAQMLGYSMEEMLDRSVFEFMDEVARREAQQKFERRKQGITEQYDLRFRRKDGSDLWTIVSTNPIFSETGEFQGAIAMITDVSDRVTAKEELRKSEEQFRLAVENFPDIFVIYDANRRLQYVNSRGIEVMGKSLEELLGRRDEEIWANEVTDGYLPLLLRAVETRTLQVQECQITLPDQKKAEGRGQKAEGIYPDPVGTSPLATDREQGFQAKSELRSLARFQEGFESHSENNLLPSASCIKAFSSNYHDLRSEHEKLTLADAAGNPSDCKRLSANWWRSYSCDRSQDVRHETVARSTPDANY